MIFFVFALGVATAFFVSSLVLLNVGRQLGLHYFRQDGADRLVGLTTVEGAVFALIGLLLAFAISGGLQRFDDRRQLVLQEASAIGTAYDRLGLFESDASALRAKLKGYLGARIELYRMPHDFQLLQGAELWSDEQEEKILELKNELWKAAVKACPQANYRPACALTLPALGEVFAVARLRMGAAEKHPPRVIYIMLFALGMGGSLLAGFGMAAAPRSWIHMTIFAGSLALTLYVMTDMEFPRLGFIRIDSFDHFLIDLHRGMG